MEKTLGSAGRSSGFQLCNLKLSGPPFPHLYAGASGAAVRFNCTNMPRGLSVAVILQSPHPILIRLVLQADPAQTPSLVANGRLRWFELFHFPAPKQASVTG